MQDKTHRLPAPKATLPDFAPVPRRKPRHDGWTPERQRAFVEALADTGCVQIAARMVNMSPESAYMLRRAPGAEGFRKAWEAAQGLGLQVVKDEAFHRAMHGQLVPVFVAGKLIGFRRKKNDRLLMFILRHYGQDAGGRKTTINYFSTKATAGAATQNPPRNGERDHPQGGGGVVPTLTAAEASTTTVKTIISTPPDQSTALAREDESARLLETFAGVDLDAQAKADIYRALEQAAERRRALDADPAEDPELWFVAAEEAGDYAGELESGVESEEPPLRAPGEHHWESLGEGGNAAEIDRAVAEMAAARQLPSLRAGEGEPPSGGEGEGKYAPGEAKVVRPEPALSLSRAQPRGDVEGPVLSEVAGDDPRLDWRNWQTGKYVEPPKLSSPSSLGEGDHPKGGGGAGPDEETDEAALPPSPPPDDPEPATPTPNRAGVGKRKRPYKKPALSAPKRRQPKPAFTPPDEAAETRAREEVAAQRRGAAEGRRVKRRKKAERRP